MITGHKLGAILPTAALIAGLATFGMAQDSLLYRPVMPAPAAAPAPPVAPGVPAPVEEIDITESHGRVLANFVQALEVPEGSALTITQIRGDIILVGTGKQQIVVHEKIRVDGRNLAQAQSIIKEVRGTLALSRKGRNQFIFTAGSWTQREVQTQYQIAVPNRITVNIQAIGGDIDLAELTGTISVENGGGNLALSNFDGTVTLKTLGGDIDVFSARGTINLISAGGDIMGRKIHGSLKAHTGGGDIEIRASTGEFSCETGGGDIGIKDLSGGALDVRTGGGTIEFSHVEFETVEAMTNGGDLEFDHFSGTLNAATGGGDIDLRITAGDHKLYTSAGDIGIRGAHGIIRAETGSGSISIIDWQLPPGRTGSATIRSRNGDVELRFKGAVPADIQMTLLGYGMQFGKGRIDSNLPLEFKPARGRTVALYESQEADFDLQIETSHGTIKVYREKD